LLEDVISELRRVPPLDRPAAEMASLLESARIAPRARLDLPARAESYTRTCAYADDRFEVLLLNWSRSAISGIHDHGGRHCWFLVLDGEVRVDDFVRLDRGEVADLALLESRGSFFLERGDVDVRSERFDIHRVAAKTAALTLHVYARPLRAYGLYDYVAQRRHSVRATYDAMLPQFAGGEAR
jgi:hypothetical protein